MKNFKNWRLVAGGCLFAVGVTLNTAYAYDSSDTRVPSPTYRSTNSVTYLSGVYKVDSFFDVFLDIDRIAPPPLPPGTGVNYSFFDVFTELSIEGPGLPSGLRESPTRQTLRLNGLPPGVPCCYDTEMLQLDIQGGQLPPGVMIRESPTKQSLGKISMSDAGGGLYHIDSFFDVFTELSLDGGANWIPSDGGSSPGAALHIVGSGVPEPSSALLAPLGAVALVRCGIRRRNG